MARPSDHWLARNFAANDPATRNNMRNLIIPGWRKEIKEWEEVITELEKPDDYDHTESIADAKRHIEELKNNIAAAEERLNQT